MPWTIVDTDEDPNWQTFGTNTNSDWMLNNSFLYSVGGISGAAVSEVSVSGLTDSPPVWTLVET